MRNSVLHPSFVLLALSFLLTVGVGCNESTTPASPTGMTGTGNTGSGGAGGSGGSGSGKLSIKLTDSPFSEADAVFITFSEVSVHRSGADWETLPFANGTTRTCDLKQLQGATDVLGVGSLAAGHYTQIRLTIQSARIFFDHSAASGPCANAIAAPTGNSATVDVPSGILRLNREFTVPSGGATTITLDFDGDRSIKQTGSTNGQGQGRGNGSATKYILTPVIAVVSVQ